jgi:hypothetical protein
MFLVAGTLFGRTLNLLRSNLLTYLDLVCRGLVFWLVGCFHHERLTQVEN